MSQKHHIIYVPGIMDDIYRVQGFLVWLWFVHGVSGHCHEMPWKGEEQYEPKMQKLLALIDKCAESGNKVSLVGASAGASAVINAYVQRRESVQSVALICAKVNFPDNVGKRTYEINPAFKTSMYTLQKSLGQLIDDDKSKIMNYYSPTDQTVPYIATTIPGVKEFKLRPLRHGQAIIYSLSFGSRKIIKSLKQA